MLSDEDKAAITARVEELAAFDTGDRVTVEPSNVTGYFAEEYEGVLLTVEEPLWRGTDISRYTEEGRHSDYIQEERIIDLPDNGRVYLDNITYRFNDERVPLLGERTLIAWQQYRESNDRVYLKTDSEHSKKWLQPADESCDVCGCNTRQHWFHDDGFNQAGSEECAACGHMFECHTP